MRRINMRKSPLHSRFFGLTASLTRVRRPSFSALWGGETSGRQTQFNGPIVNNDCDVGRAHIALKNFNRIARKT